jgi:MFS transporter, DHA1 family, inner membrane transport protein
MSAAPEIAVPSPRPALIGVLVLSTVYSVLNVTLLSPLLKEIGQSFSVSDSRAGQLSTVTAASACLTALLASPLIGRYSLRSWLRLKMAIVLGATLLTVAAPTFPLLLLARGIAGIGGAFIIGICFAAAADSFPDVDARNRVIGLITMSAILGGMVGLPVMTLVNDVAGWRWSVAVLIPVGGAVLAGSGVIPAGPRAGYELGWRQMFAAYRQVLAHRPLLLLLCAIVLVFTVRFGSLMYLGGYSETVFAAGATLLGVVYILGGFAQMIAAFLVPLLLRSQTPRRIASGSALFMAINLALVGTVYSEAWSLVPFNVIASLTFTACFIPINILLLDTLPAARGTVMSLQSAAMELGIALGLASVGAALTRLDGYEATYRALALAPPLVVLILLIVARIESHAGGAPGRSVVIPAPVSVVDPADQPAP